MDPELERPQHYSLGVASVKRTLLLLAFSCCWMGTAWSQGTFNPGDRVEVDIIMSGAPERAMYRPATVLKIEGGEVFVRLDNGEERSLPLRPDKHWVKAATSQAGANRAQSPAATTQGAGLVPTVGQRVDVDIIMSGSPERAMYRSGTVTRVANNEVFVKLDNGEERSLPLRPDKHWVRPSQAPAAQTAAQPPRPAEPVKPVVANPAGLAQDDVRRPKGLGAPPSGIYQGQTAESSSNLEIKGMTYRVQGDPEFYPYTLDAAGGIHWSRGLSVVPNSWVHVSSFYAGKDPLGRPYIKAYYVSKGGNGMNHGLEWLKER